MSTLTGSKIKDTYDGLLKTQNSATLPTSGRVIIEDGLGVDSALELGRVNQGIQVSGGINGSLRGAVTTSNITAISTDIDVDASLVSFDSVVEIQDQLNCIVDCNVQGTADLGALKLGSDQVNAIITENEGIGANDNDNSLPTSAAVKDYVDNFTPSNFKNVTMYGMVNNLASQASGGYDYMEWTSNATPENQVPAILMVEDLKLVKVGLVWLGQFGLNLTGNEKVEFTLRKCLAGATSQINNYSTLGSLFDIDANDSGTFPNRLITLATPINVNAGDIIACVGQETGTVTPNNGELAITFLFEQV